MLSFVVNNARTIAQLSEKKRLFIRSSLRERRPDCRTVIRHKMNHNYVTEEKGMTEQVIKGDEVCGGEKRRKREKEDWSKVENKGYDKLLRVIYGLVFQ